MVLINRRQFIATGVVAATSGISAPFVWAQRRFPERPIRVIVPYAPGGVGDATCGCSRPAWSKSSARGL